MRLQIEVEGGWGGVSACSRLHEQTPGLSQIHPHNLPISPDKPSRAADSRGRVDCPKTQENLGLPGRRHYAYPFFLPGCFPPVPTISPPGPTGNQRPHQPEDRGSSWATPLILPPTLVGVGLMDREGACTNIAPLTYVCNPLHTPSYANILYTERKAGAEYTTTNLLHL